MPVTTLLTRAFASVALFAVFAPLASGLLLAVNEWCMAIWQTFNGRAFHFGGLVTATLYWVARGYLVVAVPAAAFGLAFGLLHQFILPLPRVATLVLWVFLSPTLAYAWSVFPWLTPDVQSVCFMFAERPCLDYTIHDVLECTAGTGAVLIAMYLQDRTENAA